MKLPKDKKREDWPIIRKCQTKMGADTWMVDGRIRGKGPRSFHPTKAEATTIAEQMRIQRKNEGTSAFSMPQAERADAVAALEMIHPYGITLREAVRFYTKHHQVFQKNVGLDKAIEEYLAVRKADGISPHTFIHTRAFLRRFSREFPNSKLQDFNTPVLDDYLRALSRTLSPASRNQIRRKLGGFFSFAFNRNYMIENPVPKTFQVKPVEKPIGILTVSQATRLLAAADDNIRACLALGLFAGLRPLSEVLRLDWSDIDFERRRINIDATRTKSARHRFVTMQDNLVQWLLPLRRPAGLIGPCEVTYCRRSIETREKAGIVTWPADVLRHTYGSMHFAKFKNAGDTAFEMGHRTTAMLFKHYRAKVTEEEAAAFWNIRPERRGNIIEMAPPQRERRLPLPGRYGEISDGTVPMMGTA